MGGTYPSLGGEGCTPPNDGVYMPAYLQIVRIGEKQNEKSNLLEI